MSAIETPVQPLQPLEPGLTQAQRFIYTFTAPSKTFNDIKRNGSWWLPFLITAVAGWILWSAINTKITWEQVYENNQQLAPQWAKDMQERQPPEQRAAAANIGPASQKIFWAASPFLLLVWNMIAAGVLLVTINFGFGGRAKFSQILSVEIYAGLVSWVLKFLIGTIAIFAGLAPESFNVNNVSGTNIAYYLNQQETPKVLYTLALALDPVVIWTMVLTAIGVSIVAGVKRSSGYITVFGWWALAMLIFVGISAAS
jgi:hypothetical protein